MQYNKEIKVTERFGECLVILQYKDSKKLSAKVYSYTVLQMFTQFLL